MQIHLGIILCQILRHVTTGHYEPRELTLGILARIALLYLSNYYLQREVSMCGDLQ